MSTVKPNNNETNNSQEGVRPLRISKLSLDPTATDQLNRRLSRTDIAGATIGTKTKNLRSFWSDMEKRDDKGLTNSPSFTRAAQVNSLGRNRFENNIFVQEDRSAKSSPGTDDSPPNFSRTLPRSFGSPRTNDSPTLASMFSHSSSGTFPAQRNSFIDPNRSPPQSAMRQHRHNMSLGDDSLFRTSSLSRSGSVRGPREPTNVSPPKPKKVVTFNNSARVIEYEQNSPEVSSSASFESRESSEIVGDDDDDDDEEEEEEEDEDDSMHGVPILEPEIPPSPLRHHRPLPQIPQGMEEQDIESGNESVDSEQRFGGELQPADGIGAQRGLPSPPLPPSPLLDNAENTEEPASNDRDGPYEVLFDWNDRISSPATADVAIPTSLVRSEVSNGGLSTEWQPAPQTPQIPQDEDKECDNDANDEDELAMLVSERRRLYEASQRMSPPPSEDGYRPITPIEQMVPHILDRRERVPVIPEEPELEADEVRQMSSSSLGHQRPRSASPVEENEVSGPAAIPAEEEESLQEEGSDNEDDSTASPAQSDKERQRELLTDQPLQAMFSSSPKEQPVDNQKKSESGDKESEPPVKIKQEPVEEILYKTQDIHESEDNTHDGSDEPVEDDDDIPLGDLDDLDLERSDTVIHRPEHKVDPTLYFSHEGAAQGYHYRADSAAMLSTIHEQAYSSPELDEDIDQMPGPTPVLAAVVAPAAVSPPAPSSLRPPTPPDIAPSSTKPVPLPQTGGHVHIKEEPVDVYPNGSMFDERIALPQESQEPQETGQEPPAPQIKAELEEPTLRHPTPPLSTNGEEDDEGRTRSIAREPESQIPQEPAAEVAKGNNAFATPPTSHPLIMDSLTPPSQEPAKKEDGLSPAPSLDHNHSPTSMDSPVKANATPEELNEWPVRFENNDVARREEFASDYSGLFDVDRERRDDSLKSLSGLHSPQFGTQRSSVIEIQQNQGSQAKDNKGQYDDRESESEEEPAEEEVPRPIPAGVRKTIRSASGKVLKARPSITPMDVTRISHSRKASAARRASAAVIHNELRRKHIPLLELSQDTSSSSIFDDLDEEFERLLTIQKRGYTLRENDRLVIASERRLSETRNQSQRRVSSPVKRFRLSHEPVEEETPETLHEDKAGEEATNDDTITPPENPQIKPPSVKMGPDPSSAKTGPAVSSRSADNDMSNNDRGRLFVRIISVKNINLPGVEERNAKFSLTLDNGIHCISTNYKSMKKVSMLDQEFELTVNKDLEFILTLKAKSPKIELASVPAPQAAPIREPSLERNQSRHSRQLSSSSTASSIAPSITSKKKLGFSRLFGSPKKKATQILSKPSTPLLQPSPNLRGTMTPTPTLRAPETRPTPPRRDPWDGLIATDGSFGRAYMALSQYESEIYGRPATYEIPCYNEWERSGTGSTRRAPYKIAKLQIQMMFIPRGSRTESLPASIKEALEEMRAYGDSANSSGPIEGYLSQLGGDCKYWRRRYFKVRGTIMTAYSENSGKARATINLGKATGIIDDKGSLTAPVDKGRRQSAFAKQEEAFMFVDEGFRLKFANGEIIDFYADDQAAKQNWIRNLNEIITGNTSRKPWVELILKRAAEKERM
ncbi:hypothetical protein TRVA0_033S00100 [Trichomonascus vanleenenianus]|uniref:Bud4p n=1 Tax=Trichomonascus vanleenenianus TaxID=2268995 RepID=UPI003ECADE9B